MLVFASWRAQRGVWVLDHAITLARPVSLIRGVNVIAPLVFALVHVRRAVSISVGFIFGARVAHAVVRRGAVLRPGVARGGVRYEVGHAARAVLVVQGGRGKVDGG